MQRSQADEDCPAVGVSVRIRPGDRAFDDHHRPVICDAEHAEHRVDVVHDEGSSQDEIFEQTGLNVVESFLRGSDALFITYGSARSGKTYSLQGKDGSHGVIQRACKTVCDHLCLVQDRRYFLSFSCCALTSGPEALLIDVLSKNKQKLCSLRESSAQNILHRLVQKKFYTFDDFAQLVPSDESIDQKISSTVGFSCDSHKAFIFKLSHHKAGQEKTPLETKLTFVEFAGSKRKGQNEALPTSEETALVAGLSALTSVFKFLGNRKYTSEEKKTNSSLKHVPWRESPLTKWIQPSMEKAKVIWLLGTVDNHPISAGATISTLNFLSRIRCLSQHSPQSVVIRPQWIQICRCSCPQHLSINKPRTHSDLLTGMQADPLTKENATSLLTHAERKNSSDSCARLVLTSTEDQRHVPWSKVVPDGDGAFAELFAIVRRCPGNLKGEALLESLLQQSCHLREQLYVERTRSRRLQAETEDLEQEVEKLQTTTESFADEKSELHKQLKEQEAAHAEKQLQINEQSVCVEELQERLRKASVEHEGILQKERMVNHRSACKAEEWSKEVDRLRSQVDLLSEQVGLETSSKLSLQSKLEILQREYACCDQKLGCLNDYCKNLESEKVTIMKDCKDQIHQMKVFQTTVTELSDEKKQLEENLERTQKMNVIKDATLQDLQKQNDRLKQQAANVLHEQEHLILMKEELEKVYKIHKDLQIIMGKESHGYRSAENGDQTNRWHGIGDELLIGFNALRQELSIRSERVIQANNKLANFRNQYEETGKSLRMAESQLLSIQKQVSKCEQASSEDRREKQKLLNSLSLAENQMEQFDNEKEVLLSKLKETTARLMESIEVRSSLEAKLSTTAFNEEKLQRQLKDEEKALETVEKNCNLLKQKLVEREKEQEDSAASYSTLEKRNESLLIELQHQQFKTEALRDELTDKESRLKVFNQQVIEFAHQVESLQEENRNLKETSMSIESKNKNLNESLLQQSVARKDLDQRVEKLSLETRNYEVERLRSMSDREKHARELSHFKKQTAQFEDLHQQQAAENRKLSRQLEALQEDNHRLEVLSESIKTCAHERDVLKQKAKSLNNEIEALLTTNKKLKNENESLQTELTATESALRKQKMDTLVSLAKGNKGPNKATASSKSRLRRSQTDFRKRSTRSEDSLNAQRRFSSIPSLSQLAEPVIEEDNESSNKLVETVSERVARLASNASEVLDEIGRSLATEQSSSDQSNS